MFLSYPFFKWLFASNQLICLLFRGFYCLYLCFVRMLIFEMLGFCGISAPYGSFWYSCKILSIFVKISVLSIIIPVWKEHKTLDVFLRKLISLIPKEAVYEIIVVRNTEDEPYQLEKAYGQRQLLLNVSDRECRGQGLLESHWACFVEDR